MKLFIFLALSCSFLLSPLYSSPIEQNELSISLIQNEICALDKLIEATQKNFDQQQKVRFLLKDYLKYRQAFIDDSDNKEMACTLMTLANELLKEIETNYLQDYFSEEFLTELHFFSQIVSSKKLAPSAH